MHHPSAISVLVLDDVPAIVEELVTLLELQGISAAGAETLGAGLDTLEKMSGIRVIACDVRLGHEWGFDIVSLIADRPQLSHRTFKFVFISGDPVGAEHLPHDFPYLLLTKPVQPRALVSLVRKLLATGPRDALSADGTI